MSILYAFICYYSSTNINMLYFFLGFLVHDQLHFHSTAVGFKMYSLSFPTIALLDGLLDQADSQNLCRQTASFQIQGGT